MILYHLELFLVIAQVCVMVTGMGSNGGTQPWNDLSVYWFSYDVNGEIDDAVVFCKTVPRDTHSSTQFEFTLNSANLVGKQVSVNFYNNANTEDLHRARFLLYRDSQFLGTH